MDEEMTTEDCLLQPGGCVEINYKHLQVLAPRNDIMKMLVELRAMSAEEKAKCMKSVNRQLDKEVKASAMRDIGKKRSIQMAQDITIWFANEIVEGRAKLAS